MPSDPAPSTAVNGNPAPATPVLLTRRERVMGSIRRLIIPLAAILAIIGLLVFSNSYWDHWISDRQVQATDDAYIRSDVSLLSARIAGNILRVLVDDYQTVKAGQPLVEIDPADYQAAVDGAQAVVAGAVAALDNLKNQKALQNALIIQAEAQLTSAVAVEKEMSEELVRQQTLLKGGITGTQQLVQQATASLDKASADVRSGQAAIDAARSQLNVLIGQEATLRANLDGAKASLESAQLKLSYTTITAPFDGLAGARLVQISEYVNIGTNLIAVVPIPKVYVIANFKEVQLTHVMSGQPVEIRVDTFPGQMLRGTVERVSPASGAVFALLPPDNATGNFTKVVQRIPVRIAIDPDQPLVARLRAGMSVEARIDVGDAR